VSNVGLGITYEMTTMSCLCGGNTNNEIIKELTISGLERN